MSQSPVELQDVIVEELINEDNLTNDNEVKKNTKKINTVIKFLVIIIIFICVTIVLILSKMGKIGFIAWQGENIDISEKNMQVLKNARLTIFDNKERDGKSIIYPLAQGTYKFNVKNSSRYKMIYNIRFSEEMSNKINMKYRLKMDNVYIRGNEDQYIDLEQLDVENVIVQGKSNNVYTLEWKWEESENDTEIGSMEEIQYYTFKLQIIANIYDDKRSEKF